MGRATWHAFSFGPVYDPEWVGFGPMTCHDEHLLAAGAGFPDHAHADLEIVSWVVSGALRHTDSLGHSAVLTPGQVGHLRAGSGVIHSEVATAPQTRFVQAWLLPEEYDVEPAYSSHTVASSSLSPALTIGGAALFVSTLANGESVTLPTAPLVHVFVASGALLRNSLAEPLAAGDAFLMTDEPAASVTAALDTTLLVWALGLGARPAGPLSEV
ncbi:pirin family protein [Nocardioides sp.]|uniref:pirin family protein n=1 Tax=Nocardioides sp. TaxID=35761 RepID=UPI0039E30FB7